jgi:drug/metabolite transporter (DMT)-like permease
MIAAWRAELGLAFVCLLWGSTFVMVKAALDDVSTVLFLGLRFSLAAVVLAGVYFLRGGHTRTRGGFRAGAITGGLLFAGYLLQTFGLRYTTPAKSGFLTALYIVLVPLLAAAVYQKAPGVSEWIGVVLATIGIGLLTLNTARVEIGAGDALTIGCAFAFAAHILALGHYSRSLDTDWLTLMQIVVCAAVALSTFPWVEVVFVRWSRQLWVAIAVTSLLATALAFWIQTWAQARTTPTRAALIFSLEPLFAWLTSYLLADEVLSFQAIAGAACIMGGILAVELKPIGGDSHPES